MAQSRSKRTKLVILIPAYNEASTIAAVIQALPKRIAGILTQQVVVINDGSTDQTALLAKKAGAKVISHPQNLGVGQAMQTGLETALSLGADYIVSIDADGQFQPRDIRSLLRPLISGQAEVVTASRFLDSSLTPQMPHSKYWGNRLMAWFLSTLLKQHISDATCGFRAYTKEALLKLQLFGRYTYTQEMFLQFRRQNLAFVEVPVQVLPTKRPGGKSHVVGNLPHYVFQASIILIRSLRDYKPFHFFGLPAVFLSVLGIIAGLFTLFHYLNYGAITPYKSLGFIALFALLAGMLLFIFALIADMMDRLRSQQEKILYYQRLQFFGKKK
jgi:glycosyltransferase involved in cell wall biosynthesis